MTIDDLRQDIDRLDSALLHIFNVRASLALRIGEVKKTLTLPVYDPAREKRIFARMKELNTGRRLVWRFGRIWGCRGSLEEAKRKSHANAQRRNVR